jgi:hypothetical protein
MNLGFEIENMEIITSLISDKITPDLSLLIFKWIADNGKLYNSTKSMKEVIRRLFFVSDRIAKTLICQSLYIKLVCMQLMNDVNKPNNIAQLKTQAFAICIPNINLRLENPYTVEFSTMQTQFEAIIDLIILYSVYPKSGNWGLFSTRAVTNCDYNLRLVELEEAYNS